MSTNLYDVLGVTSEASPEQIRKAYRSKALKTHPDRLPPDATPTQKAEAEEQFRKVNNAYEILNDSEKREMFDRYGVWPPPQETPTHSSRHSTYPQPQRPTTYPNGDPFDHPFFNRPFAPSYTFTDPFELFDSMFPNMFPHERPHHRSRSRHTSNPYPRPSFQDPFQRMANMNAHMDNVFASMERNMMTDFNRPFMDRSSDRFLPPFGGFPHMMTSSFGNGQSGYASEGFMSTTVNGVTHTVHKRRDWDGTEHVHTTFPDGRKVHTVNGIEQPEQGFIASAPNSNGNHPRMIQPTPSYSSHSSASSRNFDQGVVPQHMHHPGHQNYYGQPDTPRRSWSSHNYNRDDNVPVVPTYAPPNPPHHKKKWWSRA